MTTENEKQGMSIDEKRVYIFYAFTFGLAYLLVLILYMTGGLLSETELFPGYRLATVITTVYLVLPGLGHVLTRLVTKEGWKHLNLMPKIRKGWKYWLLGWLGVPVLIAFGATVFFLFFSSFYDPELGHVANNVVARGIALENLAVSLGTLLLWETLQKIALSPILNLPMAFGSEFGWRGYLQPKLMGLGPRKALLITGASWGLFLAPLVSMGYTYGYFDIYYPGAPVTGMIMMIIACTYMGVVIGWLSYRGGSLWPAVIASSMITGVAEVALLVSQGAQPLLLGPTVNGIVGGLGFVICTILILTVPKATESVSKPRRSWKTPKEERQPNKKSHSKK